MKDCEIMREAQNILLRKIEEQAKKALRRKQILPFIVTFLATIPFIMLAIFINHFFSLVGFVVVVIGGTFAYSAYEEIKNSPYSSLNEMEKEIKSNLSDIEKEILEFNL